ncbi:MAG: ribosome small subunit-dependent GTPase A [Candidatus Reconcilbacillus cellulovorans]|uniref:Small ribosomal subunit biogenesis GTPase RsgA n=1 Tax=Candidatus Reconcilbacillus cellulovorans TaxID=1906605 RepID=A0A2A6E402_9BACL|nr:MAG: ribosome small subunit-dependent GTPase A [Candidatus Reconcilbacillus cellulovorans]
MPEGRIVRALSGYYDVLPDGADGVSATARGTIRCRARGVFRKDGRVPLVGDKVRYAQIGPEEGFIEELMPRTTELTRPPVANVDTIAVVASVAEPEPNLTLTDRLLAEAELIGTDAFVVLTKVDLAEHEPETIERLRRIYEKAGYEVLLASVVTRSGLDAIAARLAGRLAVLAGPSGVGKSSLLNALCPGLSLEIGEISRKLGRGRHTTRRVELIALPGGGWAADAPGFSQLDLSHVEPERLAGSFREFRRYRSDCRFRGCLHVREPGCAVRAAVERGEIEPVRYRHYEALVEEIRISGRRY